MPFVGGLSTFVRVWSMFSIARESSYSCRSGARQSSGPRSVSTRQSGIPCVSKNGTTRSFRAIGRRERRLRVVELRERYLAVGVDERLLVDPPHALRRPDVERALRAAAPRALALELALGLPVRRRLLERRDLGLGEDHFTCQQQPLALAMRERRLRERASHATRERARGVRHASAAPRVRVAVRRPQSAAGGGRGADSPRGGRSRGARERARAPRGGNGTRRRGGSGETPRARQTRGVRHSSRLAAVLVLLVAAAATRLGTSPSPAWAGAFSSTHQGDSEPSHIGSPFPSFRRR